MEASAASHVARRGLLVRRAPVLKLERDERLVALIRAGHGRAFEVLFDRYHARLLAFCSSMLKSRQDAEDVLQEVFVNAHKAMLADERKINVRPWLYRIARNRCLNHMRKPVPEGQDSMDVHPHLHGTTTAERVQEREELRQVLADVGTLPETQRTALLLREIDQLSYDDIAVAMETTIPAVKSLLVRARISLAESSEARTLSCDEVRVTLAEAAEGIRKADGPVRAHVRRCEGCQGFRRQLRSDRRALAAILPIGPLALLKSGALAKLFGGGGASTGASGAATSSGALGAIGGGGAAAAGGGAAGGLGAIGGAIGGKAAAGVATAALLTAGAVEVGTHGSDGDVPAATPVERVATPGPPGSKGPERDRAARRLLATAAGTGAAIEALKAEESSAAEPGEQPTEEAPPGDEGSNAEQSDAEPQRPEQTDEEEVPELPEQIFEEEQEQPDPGAEGSIEDPDATEPEPTPEPGEEGWLEPREEPATEASGAEPAA